ncbi:hypothetical protein NDA16_003471 [Ustilago loliicola]|nr:hypothetical protein NDA16_003471 [Ustilago loliicola]
MTSLSQYASRFLSSGLATSVRPGVDADQDASDPSDPLFYSHASVSGAPFSHPNNRHNPYGPEYSLSSSDGLPTPPAHGRPGTQSGILHSLTGASRFGPASFLASARGRPAGAHAYGVRDSLIREIDDEDDVDLWRDDRRMPGLASRLAESSPSDHLADSLDASENAAALQGKPLTPRQTPAMPPETASSAAGPSTSNSIANSRGRSAANDTQDPFLADGDLDDGASQHSLASTKDQRTSDDRSVNASTTEPHPYSPREASSTQTAAQHQRQAAARARGWLAHGSTIDVEPSARRNPSHDPSSSIYSNAAHKPDRSQLADSSIYAQTSRTNKARAKASRSNRNRNEGLFSIYDEREEEHDDDDRSDLSRSRSGSVSASSVTDSEYDTEGEGRRAQRSRRMSRNRARQMTSTLREPLLPSGSGNARPLRIGIRHSSESESEGSDLDAKQQRYGRGDGRPSSRKNEQDLVDEIHLYPAPPAKAGWGPWANRLAFGKYRDKTAIATFAAAICAVILIGAYLSWGVRTPSQPKSPKTRPSSYYTITRSLPILVLLTLLSFAAGVGNLVLLRNLSRFGGAKVLRTGLMGVPIVLGLGWAWAFAGSFIYDDEAWSGGGWSTTGLRIISIVPLALAILFARMVWQRRKALSRSIAVLELSCNIVLMHPALLVLALASLGAFALVTIPFLFLFTRLFLVGHFGRQVGDSMEWQTDTKAAWLAWATLCAWLWTWAVLRGVQRVTVAGVVSHWYFHRIGEGEAAGGQAQPSADPSTGAAAGPSGVADPRSLSADKRRADEDHSNNVVFDQDDDSIYGESPAAPGSYPQPGTHNSSRRHAAPDPTEVVRVSFARATGPALGSICMSALILAIVKTMTVVAETARRVSDATTHRRVPKILQPLTHVVALLAGLSAVLQSYSDLALVYVGVTGDGFWTAAKKSAQLVSRRGVQGVMEGLVINLVLDLTAIALSFLAGLVGFLFSAHQLHVPADAPLVGLLCGLLPYWTLRLCADVLSNASDTLYLCYAIDHASNDEHCPKAAEAFTAKPSDISDSILPF